MTSKTLHLLTHKDGPPLYRRLRWLSNHYRERFCRDVAIHTCRKGADGLWACSWPDCNWAWPGAGRSRHGAARKNGGDRMSAMQNDTTSCASLDMYIEDINRYPLLSASEEQEIARRKMAGDAVIAWRNSMHTRGLAAATIMRRLSRGLNMFCRECIADGYLETNPASPECVKRPIVSQISPRHAVNQCASTGFVTSA